MHKVCCVIKPVTGFPVIDMFSEVDQMSILDEQAVAAQAVLPINLISLLLDLQSTVAKHMQTRGLSVTHEEAFGDQCTMQTATDGSIESWPAHKVEIQVCLAQIGRFV